MENNTIFNKTFNTCYIKPRLPNFPNGLHLDYNSCPESYNNLTKKLLIRCCLQIMVNILEESKYRKIQAWLTYNSSTLLIIPAIIFNSLSLIVLTTFKKLNSSDTTINFYMKCLCIFDILTVLSKFFHEFVVVRNTIRESPFKLTTPYCRFSFFTESVFSITSIYILILMSFDKLICVAFPLNVGTLL